MTALHMHRHCAPPGNLNGDGFGIGWFSQHGAQQPTDEVRRAGAGRPAGRRYRRHRAAGRQRPPAAATTPR